MINTYEQTVALLQMQKWGMPKWQSAEWEFPKWGSGHSPMGVWDNAPRSRELM